MHRDITTTTLIDAKVALCSIFALLLVGAAPAPRLRNDVATIRELRTASNAAIARHDGDGAVAAMRDDVKVIISDNKLIPDRPAMLSAFQRSFADAQFITFLRRPERIDLDAERMTASEAGQWTGQWRSDCGTRVVTGRYFARWIRGGDRWQIASELFVPLRRTGGCAKP
jgi:ketosteroid isomerase-like protein